MQGRSHWKGRMGVRSWGYSVKRVVEIFLNPFKVAGQVDYISLGKGLIKSVLIATSVVTILTVVGLALFMGIKFGFRILEFEDRYLTKLDEHTDRKIKQMDKHIEEAWTGIVPTLSTNQMQARQANVPYGTVVLSTPNKTVGIGKWFYQNYLDAKSSLGAFKPFEIHWKDVEELAGDPLWYKTQCDLFGNDKRKIEQELEMKFLPSTGSFFDEGTCKILQESSKDPFRIMKLYNGEAHQFCERIEGRHYLIGVDTAAEHGDDFSAITVWDYITLEQVWEFQGKCSVPDFVKVVKLACAQYPGTLVIERNSYGEPVISEINESDFSFMLYKEKKGNQLVPGVYTDARTRPLMIDALYSYVAEFAECIKSNRLSLELIGLISKPNGRVEADQGCHDDLVMSAACAFYVRKYDPPLMLDSNKNIQHDFMNIVGMNTDKMAMTNNTVIREVKKGVEEGKGGFIDVLKFYNRG